jgi:flagellar basal-body rod protein FlgG
MQIGLGVRPVTVAKEYVQGSLKQTFSELDIAIEGAGFFQVTRPDGTTMYTRAGSFKRDDTGNMVTGDGDPLIPSITIPSGALKIDIGQDGTVSVLLAGAAQSTQVGQIQLVRFDNPAGLIAQGNNLFSESTSSGSAQQGTPGFATGFGLLQQGFLEMSNVNIADEMVNMIMAQRAYELNAKVIQASDEMLQTVGTLKR